MSTEQNPTAGEEEKSQAQQDYEKGMEFLQQQETAQAANAFHNALIGFQQEKNDIGTANASARLGDLCGERGDVENALAHYGRAYAICQEHKDRLSLFSIEKKKAALVRQTGNHQEAVALYLDILDEYGVLRNPQGSVETLQTLAAIYLDMGERGKAADSLRMAATIHRNFKHQREAEALLQQANELEAG
jgi:tetratricopeptide (TPR) repeat protein